MRSDLTTDHPPTTLAFGLPVSGWLIQCVRLLAAMLLGMLFFALAYQIPATHTVDIGGLDSAYVQGFHDAERGDTPYLEGSDDSARWTRDVAYLLFPQAGAPAQVTLRLRGREAPNASQEVTVLLNGAQELGRIRIGSAWEEHTFTINGGLFKLNDVVVEIRSETAPVSAEDRRPVGVLLDRAVYRTTAWPILPYPAPLVCGAVVAGALYLLIRRTTNDQRRTPPIERQGNKETGRRGDDNAALLLSTSPLLLVWLASAIIFSVAFLLLYRLQPPYPYPLRGLPMTVAVGLAALVGLRDGPAIARRMPALLDVAALGSIAIWIIAVLISAREHVTLSTPGVEKDFRVFALRSAQLIGQFPEGVADQRLDGVFRADGFYNLGYPFLLWLVRPLTEDNPFLAARVVGAFSGALLLGATWLMARRLLSRGSAILALLVLALNPLTAQYALYVGTDMPFAAFCTLALALLVPANDERRTTNDERREPAFERSEGTNDTEAGRPGDRETGRHGDREITDRKLQATDYRQMTFLVLAGFSAGSAFLMRHLGMLLLPLGWFIIATHNTPHTTRHTLHASRFTLHASLFTLSFLIAILPQLALNTTQTGQPLYNRQGENVWLAVFAGSDWSRSDEAPEGISATEVALADPGRFFTNWWGNVRAYVGTGGEDTSEFGRAVQLRLLGFPANWLAIAGLLSWVIIVARKWRQGDKKTGRQGNPTVVSLSPCLLVLLTWIVLYVLVVSIGLALQPRFVLPLVPIYALAAAWVIAQIPTQWNTGASRIMRFIQLRTHAIAGLVLIVLLMNGFAIGARYVLDNQPDDHIAAVQLVRNTLGPSERLIVQATPDDSLGKYSAISHLTMPAPDIDDPTALRATGATYALWSGELGSAPEIGQTVGRAGIYTLYRIAP
jgi:4-amino-4-deoxy-L-arabinose transferase-like glycosyltransferase